MASEYKHRIADRLLGDELKVMETVLTEGKRLLNNDNRTASRERLRYPIR